MNRPEMKIRALGLLSPKWETFLRAERKKLKRIYKTMVQPRPLSEDEANEFAMKLFGCNADEARKRLSTN